MFTSHFCLSVLLSLCVCHCLSHNTLSLSVSLPLSLILSLTLSVAFSLYHFPSIFFSLSHSLTLSLSLSLLLSPSLFFSLFPIPLSPSLFPSISLRLSLPLFLSFFPFSLPLYLSPSLSLPLPLSLFFHHFFFCGVQLFIFQLTIRTSVLHTVGSLFDGPYVMSSHFDFSFRVYFLKFLRNVCICLDCSSNLCTFKIICFLREMNIISFSTKVSLFPTKTFFLQRGNSCDALSVDNSDPRCIAGSDNLLPSDHHVFL